MNDFYEFNIAKEILLSLEKLGYKNPTEVQKKVVPLVLKNKDIIVESQTGSGKTAAFAIPICERVEIENSNPQALILTPTRELAVQIKEDISNIGRFKKVRCTAIFGKQIFSSQVRELKQRIHVVVGTPGRTLDHIERGTINLSGINYLVIDEADEMLNMGFIDQVKNIINKLPPKRVTMLFSATMSEKIQILCHEYMKDPEVINIKAEKPITEKIKDYYYIVEGKDKFDLLKKIIYTENPDSAMIFCNTRNSVETLFSILRDKGFSCVSIHGGMLQQDRLNVIKSFSRGEFTFLVATDIAARGIDIANVTHVINYDLPFEKESYVHRIGRTGRGENNGKAISFVTPNQCRFLNEIEEYIERTINKAQLPELRDIEVGKNLFNERLKNKPKLKKEKSFELNKNILKIYINAGKKKKIRNVDIVGTISNINGVESEDIGIIDIQDNLSYIDILNGKGSLVIEALREKTMKGKKIRCERAER
ncbi:DEAD/DEAH box helicase [Clostridium pasteurianum]|uniref:ATP-dependent RNA helicase DbpA n=1 Tax=Clostridium pasteurianum BC1 TaxID=86416 RepID=R4KAV9_CLOPA|nr:DEAD/DEAH box helicase [Clostridium pasteurianum]AGK98826.1 DNA/RNA helicase, superfamily II [Clostridium pasteurianum BC1]